MANMLLQETRVFNIVPQLGRRSTSTHENVQIGHVYYLEVQYITTTLYVDTTYIRL